MQLSPAILLTLTALVQLACSEPIQPQKVTLLVTANVRGQLDPCG